MRNKIKVCSEKNVVDREFACCEPKLAKVLRMKNAKVKSNSEDLSKTRGIKNTKKSCESETKS